MAAVGEVLPLPPAGPGAAGRVSRGCSDPGWCRNPMTKSCRPCATAVAAGLLHQERGQCFAAVIACAELAPGLAPRERGRTATCDTIKEKHAY